MKLTNLIKLVSEGLSDSDLYRTLYSLRNDLVIAAQRVYDDWEQDEDGHDEVYGTGGICDDIADAMCTAINGRTDYQCFTLYNEYDCHTAVFVYDAERKEIYRVDIPPYVYEKGTGYNWKKIPDVNFKADHVEISELEWDMYMDAEGNPMDY